MVQFSAAPVALQNTTYTCCGACAAAHLRGGALDRVRPQQHQAQGANVDLPPSRRWYAAHRLQTLSLTEATQQDWIAAAAGDDHARVRCSKGHSWRMKLSGYLRHTIGPSNVPSALTAVFLHHMTTGKCFVPEGKHLMSPVQMHTQLHISCRLACHDSQHYPRPAHRRWHGCKGRQWRFRRLSRGGPIGSARWLPSVWLLKVLMELLLPRQLGCTFPGRRAVRDSLRPVVWHATARDHWHLVAH
jgi:hypothetical protein